MHRISPLATYLPVLIFSLFSCQKAEQTTYLFDPLGEELSFYQYDSTLYGISSKLNKMDTFYAQTPYAPGDFGESLERQYKILSQYDSTEVYRIIARQKRLESNLFYVKGDFKQYYALLKEAEHIMESYQNPENKLDLSELANIYNYLGAYHQERLDRDLALSYLERAYQICTDVNNHIEAAKNLANIALSKQQAYEYEAAETSIKEAIAIFEESIAQDTAAATFYQRDLLSLKNTYNNVLYSRMQENLLDLNFNFYNTQMKQYIDNCKVIIDGLTELPLENVQQEITYTYVALGSAYINSGLKNSLEDSTLFHLRAFKQLYGGSYPENHSSLPNILEGLALAIKGEIDSALVLIEAGENALNPNAVTEFFQGSYTASKAYFYLAQNAEDPVEKRKFYQKVIDAHFAQTDYLLQLRKRLGNERSVNALSPDHNGKNTYALYALYELWKDQQDQTIVDQALQISDISKTDFVRQRINVALNKIAWTGRAKKLLEREESLREDLRLALASYFSTQDAQTYIKRQQELTLNYGKFLDSIRLATDPEVRKYYNQRFYYDMPTQAQVREELLDSNSALVEYHLGGMGLSAVVITPSKSQFFHFPATEKLFNCINNYYARSTSTAGTGLMKTLFDLQSQIFAPIHQWLQAEASATEHLIVIADKKLAPIPFGALITAEPTSSQWKQQTFLLDQYTFSYHYSCADLLGSQQLQTLQAPASAKMVNYEALPSNARSGNFSIGCNRSPAEKLAQLDKKLAEKYAFVETIPQASETDIKQTIYDYQIAQLNMHGCNDGQEEPYLVAFPGQSKQDLIFLTEVYSMNLRTELLTLASCSTAAMKEKNLNRGNESLARGFIFAGAKSVLTSPYDLPEAPLTFILEAFYENLFDQKMSKAAALRAAQKAYLEQAPASEALPFFWSGLMLYGSDGSLSDMPL